MNNPEDYRERVRKRIMKGKRDTKKYIKGREG
jgi:hypothetical protein